MFVVLIAADRPGTSALRSQNKQRHTQYLSAGAPGTQVLQSGPLLGPDGSECGSLIIFEALTLDHVRAFAEGDPYSQAGLFETTDIYPWDWRRGNPYLSTVQKEDLK